LTIRNSLLIGNDIFIDSNDSLKLDVGNNLSLVSLKDEYLANSL